MAKTLKTILFLSVLSMAFFYFEATVGSPAAMPLGKFIKIKFITQSLLKIVVYMQSSPGRKIQIIV